MCLPRVLYWLDCYVFLSPSTPLRLRHSLRPCVSHFAFTCLPRAPRLRVSADNLPSASPLRHNKLGLHSSWSLSLSARLPLFFPFASPVRHNEFVLLTVLVRLGQCHLAFVCVSFLVCVTDASHSLHLRLFTRLRQGPCVTCAS